MAFRTLGTLNAIKRAFVGTYLPMLQLPACLAVGGCGYALRLTAEQLGGVQQKASTIGIGYRLFVVATGAGVKRFELQKEVEGK